MPTSWYCLLLRGLWSDNVVLVFNRHTLGHVVDLVDSDKAGRELEHVVSERNDNELSILGSFLDVVCDD